MRNVISRPLIIILVFVAVIISSNSFALEGYGSLSGDDKEVTDIIKVDLAISENDAYTIYEEYVQCFLTKGWHFDAYNNSTLDNAKVNSSDIMFININLVNYDRFVNVSMQKFTEQGKIIVQIIQTVPAPNEVVKMRSDELRNDKQFQKVTEKEFYLVYRKDRYADKVKYLINSGSGAIQYIDFSFYDLKE